MKKSFLSVFVVALSAITVFAQAPEKLNYQGVARDNAGNVLATQSIGLQIKLHSGSGSGPVVYSETHSVTTNAFGLFNVQIGTGGNQTGTIAAIDWGGDSYFVEVGMDPNGGTSYTSMGNQQLLSVPYALYAKGADNASGTTNYVSKFTGANTLGDSQILDNGTNVGIGTTSPTRKLDVVHDGYNGIRSKSTSGYSVVDIDAADGDGGMRIFKAGSGMWFIGNDMTNDNFQIFEMGSGGERLTIERTSGNVGIGTTAPIAKLNVAANTGNYAGYFTNSNGGSSDHVVHGEATHTGNHDVTGVWGENTVAGWYGYGVKGEGGWYGVRGTASVAGTNSRYGVYGTAYGTSGTSYGVYGNANGSGTNYAGYFNGDVYSSGSYLPSDANLKSNIKDYSSALALLSSLPVKTYTYKNDGIYGQMHLPVGQQVGIMAQDLEQVFPQLVKANHFEDVESYEQGLVSKEDMESIDFKAVNYTGLVPILVKAIQEQNEVIEGLKARIEALEAK